MIQHMKTTRREDEPTYAAAFTWEDVFDALARTFPDRFPALRDVKSWRCRATQDALIVKMWDTEA